MSRRPEGTAAYKILWQSQGCHRTPHILVCSGVAHGGWPRPLPKARRVLEDQVRRRQVSCLFLRRRDDGFSRIQLPGQTRCCMAAVKMFKWRIRCLNCCFLCRNTAGSASLSIISSHPPTRAPLFHTHRSGNRAALPRGDTPPLPANCAAEPTRFEVATPGGLGGRILSGGFSEAGCRTSHQPEPEVLVSVLDSPRSQITSDWAWAKKKKVDEEGLTSLNWYRYFAASRQTSPKTCVSSNWP
ncbi:hypothetical protein CGRA01v4_07711 [Colletotrichum graminicola]|nr:hypothetical protein CGRA01v4_07711 [Colletotrichum graminicola]